METDWNSEEIEIYAQSFCRLPVWVVLLCNDADGRKSRFLRFYTAGLPVKKLRLSVEEKDYYKIGDSDDATGRIAEKI